MVRQHGVTPMEGLTPMIGLWQLDRSTEVEVLAEPQGKLGHYQATITLPSAGAWEWSIDAFGVSQRMPTLIVDLAPGSSQAAYVTPAPLSSIVGITIIALMAAAGLAFARRRARLATIFVSAVVLTGVVGIFALRDAPTASGQVTTHRAAAQGEALFVAKGCVVCHALSSIDQIRAEMGLESFSVGPDLTGRTFSRSHLISWLKNPQATKPNTMMPNLGLSGDEINALADFINAGRDD